MIIAFFCVKTVCLIRMCNYIVTSVDRDMLLSGVRLQASGQGKLIGNDAWGFCGR